MKDNLQSRVVRNAKRRGVDIKTRAQWGSQFPNVYKTRLVTRRVTVIKSPLFMSHITVTRDDGPLTGDFYADMREVEQIGFDRFGSGFSYNWGIDPRTGMVGVGMPLMAAGTHTVNDKGLPGFPKLPSSLNYMARAAAWIGMPGMVPSSEAKEAFAQLLAAHIDEGALTEDFDFKPHSFFAAKDCPTQPGRDAMDEIYRRAMNKKRN